MFGTPDASDHRKAWWRSVIDRLLVMTRLVPPPPQRPPTDSVRLRSTETHAPAASPALHEQQHVNPPRADEHRHEQQ
ncbi:MAG: hypothetical protein IT299_00710 [Dehalococcoidia bacterium]|nr:hypothetical protein [Dehalococcoidia bacterium]